MTLEEAMLEMEQGARLPGLSRCRDRAAWRVLVRRRDGNFDLIEA